MQAVVFYRRADGVVGCGFQVQYHVDQDPMHSIAWPDCESKRYTDAMLEHSGIEIVGDIATDDLVSILDGIKAPDNIPPSVAAMSPVSAASAPIVASNVAPSAPTETISLDPQLPPDAAPLLPVSTLPDAL